MQMAHTSWTWQHNGADIVMCQDDRGEDVPGFGVIRLMSYWKILGDGNASTITIPVNAVNLPCFGDDIRLSIPRAFVVDWSEITLIVIPHCACL